MLGFLIDISLRSDIETLMEISSKYSKLIKDPRLN